MSESESTSHHSGEQEEVEEVHQNALRTGDMPNCLSLLCKTDSGLAHAYVKLSAKAMKLTDIEILEQYPHLRYVDLSGNLIQKFNDLNSLKSLLWLKASNNRSETARLDSLPYLQVLDFSYNKVQTVMGIEHPLLEQLNLSFNDIPSCVGLDTNMLPSLTTLQMRTNRLTSTNGLENFRNIKHLFLADNKIESLECISSLDSLELLHLRDNQIVSFGDDIVDGKLPNLRYINLRANRIEKFDEIKKLAVLPKLRELVLLENPIVEEEDYRLETLVRVRRLNRLDKDVFDDDEREQAQEKYEEMQEEAKNAEAKTDDSTES